MLDTQLMAFLESKPADETYYYNDSWNCAVGQFNKAVGRKYDFISAVSQKGQNTFDARLETVAHERPHTFGAMLERAKKEFA